MVSTLPLAVAVRLSLASLAIRFSTARAGMGALQNRLEHTINNLDVAVIFQQKEITAHSC